MTIDKYKSLLKAFWNNALVAKIGGFFPRMFLMMSISPFTYDQLCNQEIPSSSENTHN